MILMKGTGKNYAYTDIFLSILSVLVLKKDPVCHYGLLSVCNSEICQGVIF